MEPMDDEPERYKMRLRELLIKQKSLLERLAGEQSKNWSRAIREENELTESYAGFQKEYKEWLPGYLAKYGLELDEQPESEK